MSLPAAGDRAPSARYRPALDGLRSVAVYLVVLFHAGLGGFDGGFIGVDVFFVLSGYLVTQLLLRDLDGLGRVRFWRFYSRRVRRLLPAAVVALLVTAVVFATVATPSELADSIGAFQASYLYSANWYFIDQATGYFAEDVEANPVVHFWSLGVEEQFYLLWPLLLAGLFSLTRRATGQRAVLRLAIGAGAAASWALAWGWRATSPDRAYYGTDARAYQLLVGALLALSPELFGWLQRGRHLASAIAGVGVGGLVVVASSLVELDPIERGTVVVLVTALAIAALEAVDHGPVHQVLSAGPIVYLGRISYGTYLWHWPVIIVIDRRFELSSGATAAFAALIATGLASLSFQLLEHPIRSSAFLDGRRATVVAAGLAVSVVSALVLIPAVEDRASSSRSDAALLPDLEEASQLTPVPDIDVEAIKADFPGFHDCFGEPASACTVVKGTGPHLLVVGDSHAAMIAPAFEALAEQAGFTLSVAAIGGCPWQIGLTIPLVRNLGVDPQSCLAQREDVYGRVVDELSPDVVVVMNRRYEADEPGPRYGDADLVEPEPGSPELDELLRETTVSTLDRLGADRKVLILEPTPVTVGFEPPKCLEEATVVEECRAVVDVRPTNLELLYRRLAEERDEVWSLDLDRLVCPFLPICDPFVDGLVVRRDGSHMTETFARTLAPELLRYLEDNGLTS